MAVKSKGKFKYKPRTAEQVQKRADKASSGGRDGFIKEGVKFFKPSDGDNTIRILPPTWDEADHYGYDVYVHYNIGPDNAAYACLEKMKGKSCPICEESRRARADGDEEHEKMYRPTRRVLIYLLDRDKEKEGLKIWPMGVNLDKDLSKLMVDKRTGEIYPIDDPDDGFDIQFTKEGQGLNTKYVGVQIARKSSPLDHDEALMFADSNSIPDSIQYYDYDHIKLAFTGESSDEEDEEETSKKRKPSKEESKSSKKSSKPVEDEEDEEDEDEEDEDDEEAPKKSSRRKVEEEEEDEEDEEEDEEDEEEAPKKSSKDPSFEDVREMDGDDLISLVSKHPKLRKELDTDDYDDEDELREAIYDALKLKPSSSRRDKLKNLRK